MATAVKLHVKKGDTVQVLSGKDKGKEGKIPRLAPLARDDITGEAKP